LKLLSDESNRRVLIVDDNDAIHDDYRKILGPAPTTHAALEEAARAVFDDAEPTQTRRAAFELEHAAQGEEGFEKAKAAVARGASYALAFVDMRMPPGWNGIDTITRLWEVDPEIETVLCTAYSDFSWEEVVRRLDHPERLLILKKPFDVVEVRQLALSLTAKWALRRSATCRLQHLEIMVSERARQLSELTAQLERLKRVHAGSVG
jgi:DNA-binding LytR/AlgR family response regulator